MMSFAVGHSKHCQKEVPRLRGPTATTGVVRPCAGVSRRVLASCCSTTGSRDRGRRLPQITKARRVRTVFTPTSYRHYSSGIAREQWLPKPRLETEVSRCLSIE